MASTVFSSVTIMSMANNSISEVVTEEEDGGVDLNTILGNMYFYLTAVTSILSIIGSLIIIACYVAFKDMRTVGRKLLVYLSVADFLTAFGNFLGIMWYYSRDGMSESGVKWFCEFHAALTFFSSISSFLWTVAIALHLYICVVKKDAHTADKLVPGFHVVCWVIPGKCKSLNQVWLEF